MFEFWNGTHLVRITPRRGEAPLVETRQTDGDGHKLPDTVAEVMDREHPAYLETLESAFWYIPQADVGA